jgi:hypothetical protein
MGCGCKNGGNQAPQPQQGAQPQPQQGGQPQNQTIQESIKKVVEKYYKQR